LALGAFGMPSDGAVLYAARHAASAWKKIALAKRAAARASVDKRREFLGLALVQLAHFNNAGRYRFILVITGSILAGLGFFLICAVLAGVSNWWFQKLPVPKVFGYLGSALLIPASGFLSAGMLAAARHRRLAVELCEGTEIADIADPLGAGFNRRRAQWLAVWQWRLARPEAQELAGWPQVLVTIALALSAMLGVIAVWRVASGPALGASMQQVVGGLFLVGAFPLLVLERIYANISVRVLPEALRLDRLLRAPLAACVGFGIAMVLLSVGFAWPLQLASGIAAVIFLVSAELVFRGFAMFFMPFAPLAERRSVADSSIAGLLHFGIPSFTSLDAVVQRQFGIDLSRSWALAFVRRAFFPVAAALGVAAWCVTGVTALGFDERAVYERLGLPVAVLGPGLHFHLPWPLGVMRRVELGVVHEIPIVFPSPSDATRPRRPSDAIDPTRQATAAEGPAPASADRLWDASHPWEASYLIASETRGQQGFQVVAIDLRVAYRVGLSSEAAKEAVYRIEDPEALIRGIAGRFLVQYFARYTLLDVLGQSRETFTGEFRLALQDELDRLSTGIEAIAVIVEAIHPPPGAAQAYHAVQAAEILANSQIALKRGDAIRRIKSAEQAALQERDAALAAASELLRQAQSERVLFEADRQGYRRNGQAFLLERRFDRLRKGLANSKLLIIDRHFNSQDTPSIDLRRFGLPSAEGGEATIPPTFRDEAHDQPPHVGDE
jgi:regulator of protease activity HflC (stomatin/prohibitin superfamily)